MQPLHRDHCSIGCAQMAGQFYKISEVRKSPGNNGLEQFGGPISLDSLGHYLRARQPEFRYCLFQEGTLLMVRVEQCPRTALAPDCNGDARKSRAATDVYYVSIG